MVLWRPLQNVLLCAALVTVLAGGCNGANGRPPQGATVATEAPATTFTTVATTTTMAYDVPAVIDEAYVERVMAALDQVLGDGIRVLGRERRITEEFLDHLTAIYTQDEFEVHLAGWVEEGRQEGFAARSPDVGNPKTDVHVVARALPTCIVVGAQRDFAATVKGDQLPLGRQMIALVPKAAAVDRRQLNPTPWVMAFDREFDDAAETEKSCARE